MKNKFLQAHKLLLLLLMLNVSHSIKAQTITTIAGNGTTARTGFGGPATANGIQECYGIAMDAKSNIYYGDGVFLCKISPSGIVTVFAGATGSWTGITGDGGQATDCILTAPYQITTDKAGNVLFVDLWQNLIKKIDTFGIITSIGGDTTASMLGTAGYVGDGAHATATQFTGTIGIALDSAGNIYVSDMGASRIKKIDKTSGIVNTYAGAYYASGTSYSGDGGPATAAELYSPNGIAIDKHGNLYIADTYNNRIRKVDATGIISTIAGDSTAGFSGDGGPATAAKLSNPCAVAVDRLDNVYFVDRDNQRIRKIDTSGIIRTIAGNGTAGFSGDGGPATAAEINSPEAGIMVDSAGNVYFADTHNRRLRKITACNSPVVGMLSGVSTVYSGSSITLTDTTAGGTWTSSNTAVATVSSTGVIYAVSAGTVVISYTVTNSCGTTVVTKTITVMNSVAVSQIQNNLSGTIHVIPNPNTGIFTLELPVGAQQVKVIITDLAGRILEARSNSGQNMHFDMRHLAAGTYLVTVDADSQSYHQKVVIY